MTFNEFASLDNQKKKAIVEINHSVTDRIELEVEYPLAQPNSLEMEKVQDINQDNNGDASNLI